MYGVRYENFIVISLIVLMFSLRITYVRKFLIISHILEQLIMPNALIIHM